MFLLILTLLDKQILSKGEWKMIKFKGELSRECKKYMRLRDSLVGVIAAAIGGAVLAAPIILFVCSFFPPVAGVIVYVLCWLAVVGGAFLAPSLKDIDKIAPHELRIDTEDDLVVIFAQQYTDERSLSKVECIYDLGNWYVFKFSEGPNFPPRFICQKDLIVEGTIEEFEKMFEKKIVHKK